MKPLSSLKRTPQDGGHNHVMGKIAYAAVFCLALPAFLIFWAWRLDALLPTLPVLTHHKVWGGLVLTTGLWLMLAGMWRLWKDGKGLPMNAFPPSQLVQTGVYRWVPHPIYAGSTLFLLGLFLLADMAAGVWVVMPCFIVGIVALLYGYEIPDLKNRFGSQYRASELMLPQKADTHITTGQRIAAYAYVLLPWMLIYLYSAALLPIAGMYETYLPFEYHWPVYTWAVIPYMATYAWVGIAPLLAKKQKTLRQFMLCGVLGMFIGFACFMVMPLKATPRFLDSSQAQGLLSQWLIWQREADTPACAFPSFHVFWALAAVALWRERIPAWLAWFVAILISMSCILAGMHSLLDVIAGVLLYALSIQYACLYRTALRLTEHVANSWKEWHIGSFRIINHGFYVGLASFAGIMFASILYPQVPSWWLFCIGLSCMVGGCLWGQWLEASSVLMRPFGYYGSVLGSTLGLLLALFAGGANMFWNLSAALVAIAPLIMVLGRLRCLVQGCCHGRTSSAYHGICYHQPQSRVVRIAGLINTAVYPTQLYSIVSNMLLLVIMITLTLCHPPASLIVGMYLIFSACFRFVEEYYRGEPQTPTYAKLAIYQWLAMGFVLAGAILTMLPSPAVTGGPTLGIRGIAPALLLGLIAWFAMGMDWPASNKRMSRLT